MQNALVADVIRHDYFQDFVDIYALTIAITEIHPEQANNEIRNALTHLARALEAEDVKLAEPEIRRAQDHIERGKRDCLKLAIIKLRERLSDTILLIEQTEGVIRSPIKQRLREIEHKRREVFNKETKNYPASELLEGLLSEALDLERLLEESYRNPYSTLSRVRRLWLRGKGYVRAISFASFVAIFSSYIVLWVHPVLPDGVFKAFTQQVVSFMLPPSYIESSVSEEREATD